MADLKTLQQKLEKNYPVEDTKVLETNEQLASFHLESPLDTERAQGGTFVIYNISFIEYISQKTRKRNIS